MSTTAVALVGLLGGALSLAAEASPPMTAETSPPSYDEWHEFVRGAGEGFYPMAFAGLEHGEPVFRLNGGGRALTASDWLNAEGPFGLGAGVYFFETVGGESPQGGSGVLTPPVRLRCRGGGFLMRGLVFFNAERVTCRCWRRRAVDLSTEGEIDTLPPVHATGILYNEGDLTLAGGFTLLGAARAGGELSVRGRAGIVENPAAPVPVPRRSFPPPEWDLDVATPTSWPMAAPDPAP